HMTGNKAYLVDYQEINDGGFVAFGSSRGKITGKGKIRTEKLDFDDVYFVNELKFNLFFVSQMCDKKNSVLFNETECLVLSFNFKLLDESQGHPYKALKNKGIVNSGCFRHMIGNKAYLTNYKEINDGGFVAFGSSRGKISGPQDTNANIGTQDNVDAGKEVSDQHYIVLLLWSSSSSTFKSSDDKATDDKPTDNTGSNTIEEPVNKEDQAYRDELDRLMSQEKEASDAADALRPEFEQGCIVKR
nr:ribonuclease H-like domain-containing protein [Tanacetum cinerariifolium]